MNNRQLPDVVKNCLVLRLACRKYILIGQYSIHTQCMWQNNTENPLQTVVGTKIRIFIRGTYVWKRLGSTPVASKSQAVNTTTDECLRRI
jgi:hypothetical protein